MSGPGERIRIPHGADVPRPGAWPPPSRGAIFPPAVVVTPHSARSVTMGLLDGLMGNASEVEAARMQGEFAQVMAVGEQVEKAYVLIRDAMLFTNRRLIIVDKQGITGSKVEYHSLPYRAITHFSVETAGHFDLDAELKIWVSGRAEPFSTKFNKRLSIYDVQAVLAGYVCR